MGSRWRAAALGICVICTALAWTNTRLFVMRINHSAPPGGVLPTYYYFHGMAAGLGEGRVGQLDLERFRQFTAQRDPLAPYRPLQPGTNPQWVNFYTLDIGYEFIVAISRLAFPTLPDNALRSLALQYVLDAALIVVICWFFARWSPITAVAAGLLYAVNAVFAALAGVAYYYFWDIPLTFAVLGCLTLAYARSHEARRWLTGAALCLGFGVWLRGTWWPLAAFVFSVAAFVPTLRRAAGVPLLVFGILAAPQMIRSSVARGRIQLTTRSTWHVALVGLGYYPNPYGLDGSDEAVFNLTEHKYGAQLHPADYDEHDQAAKKEFLRIARTDPAFVWRSFVGRLRDSVLARTPASMFTYLFVPNIAYRLLCLGGLVALLVAGEERRILGIAAAGFFVIYTVVTCLFYFVGLAYDNVTEVSLFVMLIGGIDAVVQSVRGSRIRRQSEVAV